MSLSADKSPSEYVALTSSSITHFIHFLLVFHPVVNINDTIFTELNLELHRFLLGIIFIFVRPFFRDNICKLDNQLDVRRIIELLFVGGYFWGLVIDIMAIGVRLSFRHLRLRRR